MARVFTESCQLVAVCFCMLLACTSSTLSVKAEKQLPSKIVIYEHEARVDKLTGNATEPSLSASPKGLTTYEHETRTNPRTGNAIAASPSGRKRSGKYTIGFSDLEFGTINVFANTLRTTVSNTSQKVGKATGQVIFEDDLGQFIDWVLLFNSTLYNGSLTLLGGVNPRGNGEIMITGGTGDFRSARGYCELFTVSNLPASAVYRYTVHLKYY